MIQAKQALLAALADSLQEIAPGSNAPAAFESPKQAAHGDFACTAAMQLAKPLKANPRELATRLIAALEAKSAFQTWVQSLEIAGPGFINIRLKPAAKQAVVAEVLTAGDKFGHRAPTDKHVMIEFVSANPTGPLHVGHARQAALGDSLCSVFQSQGHQVTREFYYNDAGVQIATLANSTQMRLKGFKPGDAEWPEAAYNGDYIQDIADAFLRKETVKADDREFTASGDVNDLDSIRQFAVAYLRHEQDLDLQAFGLKFDSYFLETSVYQGGQLEKTVERLVASGKTYEEGGALWLRTTDYGDDKDRVMRKKEGGYTYFVPDVAYHINKFERGYTQCINIQGTDHHGTIARVRAGLQAVDLGIPQGFPDYVLHKMVTVMKNGEEVKISKRAGSYVTLRDLIDWTSRDAVRFFLISRKADTEFVFDVDLALKQNDENPVFYVQYAHARICSVQRQWIEETAGWPQVRSEHHRRLKALLQDFLSVFKTGLESLSAQARHVFETLIANGSLDSDAGADFATRLAYVKNEVATRNEASLLQRIEHLNFSSLDVRKQVAKLQVELSGNRVTEVWSQNMREHLDGESMPVHAAAKLYEFFAPPMLATADLSLLTAESEMALMQKLAQYPEVLTGAAQSIAPHDIAFYARDLAAAFHSWYAAERFLVKEPALAKARMALLSATRQVLANALGMLGVSAPEQMSRDIPDTTETE